MNRHAAAVVLFLDFDGVLHPKGGGVTANLSKLPLLEELLRDATHGHVSIVISSTWRQGHSLAKLRTLFSEDIRARVLGTTPVLEEYQSEHERFEEIKGWLQRNAGYSSWVALDDDTEGFPAQWHKRVVFTDSALGLTEADISKLGTLLRA